MGRKGDQHGGLGGGPPALSGRRNERQGHRPQTRLGLARNTARATLRSQGPPSYERQRKGSIVDAVEPPLSVIPEGALLVKQRLLEEGARSVVPAGPAVIVARDGARWTRADLGRKGEGSQGGTVALRLAGLAATLSA